MNFLKWLMDILLGWIVYIPKKIIRIKTPFQEINKMAEENRLFNKDFNDKYILTALILVLPLLMSESYIVQCGFCQSLISFMSSLIPGIRVMSKESIIPNTVALEISIAWVMIVIVVLVNLYRAWGLKILFMKSSNIIKQQYVLSYLGLLTFLILEYSEYFSFFHGSMGIKSRKINFLLQHEFGVALLAYFEVMWLPMVLLGLILMSTEMLKNLGQKIQDNENN